MFKSHLVFVAAMLTSTVALSHGDVAPQPMNTDALPDVGDEWLIENPYRNMGEWITIAWIQSELRALPRFGRCVRRFGPRSSVSPRKQ